MSDSGKREAIGQIAEMFGNILKNYEDYNDVVLLADSDEQTIFQVASSDGESALFKTLNAVIDAMVDLDMFEEEDAQRVSAMTLAKLGKVEESYEPSGLLLVNTLKASRDETIIKMIEDYHKGEVTKTDLIDFIDILNSKDDPYQVLKRAYEEISND